MFKTYYKMDSEPFRLTPDPKFVFAHRRYQKAYAYMRHAVEQGDGFLVITGRSGTGKSTLAEDLLTGLSAEVSAASLVFTRFEADDLLLWFPKLVSPSDSSPPLEISAMNSLL